MQIFLQIGTNAANVDVREYLPFFVNLRDLVVGSAGGEGGWVFSPGRRDSTLLTPT